MPRRSALSVEQRRAAVLALLRKEELGVQLVRRFGVSEQTLYPSQDTPASSRGMVAAGFSRVLSPQQSRAKKCGCQAALLAACQRVIPTIFISADLKKTFFRKADREVVARGLAGTRYRPNPVPDAGGSEESLHSRATTWDSLPSLADIVWAWTVPFKQYLRINFAAIYINYYKKIIYVDYIVRFSWSVYHGSKYVGIVNVAKHTIIMFHFATNAAK
jgi:hypothetical protein